MIDLEIAAAIKSGSLVVCPGPHRDIFFMPLRLLPGDYVEARPKMNSKYLENGSFEYFGCGNSDCRLATPSEIEWFNKLRAASKFNVPSDEKVQKKAPSGNRSGILQFIASLFGINLKKG
ncbi:hypothetical protein [Pedobacter endophyticus]|uniref:Uncharacterized protein n=1 Tax=Pedobacter endophyticus TaxID=2789740 RepID=A0A7U3Q4N6_9SPHI|nr:hypothetical protein [Pedobacter endophyticus]QPH38402.1 hypothetical protein IZT61_15085 [Pedobacter endophyticus]